MIGVGNVWRTGLGARVRSLGNVARNRNSTNAFYGIADYLVLPIGMLLAAPFLLGHLGPAQYGVWVLAGAAVSSGGIVSGRFGDAAIKEVGACRGVHGGVGVVRI